MINSMTILFFSLLVLTPSKSWSNESFIIHDVDLGLQYSSLTEGKSVIFYKDFQIDPVLTFQFINQHFEFLGDNISYKQFIHNDNLMIRTRLVDISDQPLFPAHSSLKKNSPHRKSSYEWSNRIEYYLTSYHTHYLAEFDFEYGHDLFTHHGNYFALESKIKLFSVNVFEPNLFVSLGSGDKKNNNYYYGEGSKNLSLTNFSTGINLLVPEFVDRYYCMTKVNYFTVIGHENQNAAYAKNNNHGFLFTLTMTKTIY